MIEPYISFRGETADAIALYDDVFGCPNQKIYRYRDIPQDPDHPFPQEQLDWVADSEVEICGTVVHFSDMDADWMTHDGHVFLMVHLNSPEELAAAYEKLAQGAEKVLVEPSPQFYAKLYACLRDRFGIGWHLMVDLDQ